MYIIGICDDEKSTCSQIESLLEAYLKKEGVEYEIEVFYSGKYLQKYLSEKGKFDLLFLDIKLPDIDGVEIGQFIRKDLNEEGLEIVYISSEQNHAMRLFQCRPMDFLIKPIDPKEIYRIMDVFKKRNRMKKRYFEYLNDRVSHRIQLQDIMYFYSDNKKVSMVLCTGETRSFYGKLSEVLKELSLKEFIQIHKSYIVNHNYVREYMQDQVFMADGVKITISKSRRKEVQDRLFELL